MGLDYFGVWMIEAGIDQMRRFAWLWFHATAEDGKGAFGCFGRGEDVRAGTEDGRARGPDGESGVKAGGKDGSGGMDFALVVAHVPIVAGFAWIQLGYMTRRNAFGVGGWRLGFRGGPTAAIGSLVMRRLTVLRGVARERNAAELVKKMQAGGWARRGMKMALRSGWTA